MMEDNMNVIFLIRIVTLILIFIGLKVLYKTEFWKKYALILWKTKIRRIIYKVLLLIILLFIALFPFHKLLRFKSIESAIETLYPNYNIVYQKTKNNTALVTLETYNDYDNITLIKKNGKWQYNDSYRMSSASGDYTIFANEVKEKGITYILVVMPQEVNENELTIEDSLSSKFKKVDAEHEDQFYLAIITKKIDKDNYKIYINGEETISPFVGLFEFLLNDDYQP